MGPGACCHTPPYSSLPGPTRASPSARGTVKWCCVPARLCSSRGAAGGKQTGHGIWAHACKRTIQTAQQHSAAHLSVTNSHCGRAVMSTRSPTAVPHLGHCASPPLPRSAAQPHRHLRRGRAAGAGALLWNAGRARGAGMPTCSGGMQATPPLPHAPAGRPCCPTPSQQTHFCRSKSLGLLCSTLSVAATSAPASSSRCTSRSPPSSCQPQAAQACAGRSARR